MVDYNLYFQNIQYSFYKKDFGFVFDPYWLSLALCNRISLLAVLGGWFEVPRNKPESIACKANAYIMS